MSEQPPSQPAPGAPAPGSTATPPAAPSSTPTSASAPAAAAAAGSAAEPKAKAPLPELTGFRKSLEHTGLPRSVIGWKPRLPSRNWCIFLTVVGTISYIYWDDRKKCREIKEKYVEAVRPYAEVPLENTLELPRKVTVYAARWPEDDENDRGLLYFRKYVKPYLTAAAIDYELVNSPLYGSVARIVRAKVLKERREALNLNEGDVLAPIQKTEQEQLLEQQERNGGVVLVGRPTLKEYLAGLRAGWGNGVGEWKWETSVHSQLSDAPFADPEPAVQDAVIETSTPAEGAPTPAGGAVGTTGAVTPIGGVHQVGLAGNLNLPPVEDDEAPKKRGWFSGLFGGRHKPAASPQQQQQPQEPTKFVIPAEWNEPPTPLPAQKPVLLVDWCNHLGFKQIPYMIYDFFTEHKRVQSGAEAAYALITEQARPFRGPDAATPAALDSATPASASASADAPAPVSAGPRPDTDFDVEYERFYKKDFSETPANIEKDRATYYTDKLPKRVEAAKQFARGERDITDDEKRSDKPVETVQMLRDERNKKELRWEGNLEGYEIVRPETPVAWDPRFQGWLQVYEASPASLDSVVSAPPKPKEGEEEKADAKV